DRVDAATGADGAGQRALVGPGNGRLSCGVDLGQYECVDLRQHCGEIVEQVAGAAVPVRLEGHHQATVGPAAAGGLEGGGQLLGVVAVVVDHGDQPAAGQRR